MTSWIHTRRTLAATADKLRADLALAEQQRASWREIALRRSGLVEKYADDRNLAVERALTAETLLAQLYRAADLGDPPREAGRVNVHATTRAVGMALADARRAARRSASAAPAGEAVTAVLPVGDLTMHLPAALQRLVREFRMAPVIAGVARWDLSRAVPVEQLPREVEYARALLRVETVIEEMAAIRPDLAGWAGRLRAAATVPVGFTRDEVPA